MQITNITERLGRVTFQINGLNAMTDLGEIKETYLKFHEDKGYTQSIQTGLCDFQEYPISLDKDFSDIWDTFSQKDQAVAIVMYLEDYKEWEHETKADFVSELTRDYELYVKSRRLASHITNTIKSVFA